MRRINAVLFQCVALLTSVQAVKATVTSSITPMAVSNTYNGTITLQIGGLTNGETVVIQNFLDLNTNGIIEANDLMGEEFQLTAGEVGAMVIGGVTNANVPFNSSSNTDAITTIWNFQNGNFQRFAGQHLFKVSTPSGQSTNSFTVTNSYAQEFTGTVLTGPTPVANAVVFLYQSGNVVGGSVADNFGRYTVRAPAGVYALAAFSPNSVADRTAAENLVLTTGETLTTNLNLIATTESISGKIVDAKTSLGLPGLFLGVHSTDGTRQAIAFTDSDGDFSVGVTSNNWNIGGNDAVVAFLGYIGFNNGVLVSATNGSVSNLTVALPKATALFYGTLKDYLGNPLPGVRIDTGDFNGLYDNGGYTDANGNYVTGAVGDLSTNDPYKVDVYEAENFLTCIFSQSPFTSQNGGTNVVSNTAVMANFTAISSGLVLNGGFQTGDFADWTLSGDTNNTFVDQGYYSGITPYFGDYEAALETSGSLGYISQMLTTTPGASYSLSLWFDNPDQDPGEFLVSWNGNTLLDTTNLDVNNWTNVQFAVSATGTNTVLQVGFEDDYDVLGLDDISVLPTAAPAQYSITVSASPTSDGSASGSGTFPSGGVQTVTATANGGYAFVDWTENGTVVSSLANYTFTLNSNVTLVANFTTLQTIAFCTEIQTASSSSISYDSGLFTYTDSDASDTSEEHAILPLCGAAASLINSTNAWTASISISLSARTLTAPTSHAELGLVVSTNLSVPLSSAGFGFELVQENNTGDGDGGSTDIYPDGWYGTDLSFQAFLNGSRDPATPLGASQATGNGSIYLLLSGGTAGAGSSESIGGVSGTLTITYSSSNQTVVGSYDGTNVASYSIAGWGANPPLALGIWGSSGKLLAVSSGTATASNFSVSAVASSGPTPLSLVTNSGAFGFTNGVFGFSISGPVGSNVVIQVSADLKTWIPLQTNVLGSAPLYYSDSQSPTNRQRFYRAELLP